MPLADVLDAVERFAVEEHLDLIEHAIAHPLADPSTKKALSGAANARRWAEILAEPHDAVSAWLAEGSAAAAVVEVSENEVVLMARSWRVSRDEARARLLALANEGGTDARR